jgi:histidinol-phosphate aminotransferase
MSPPDSFLSLAAAGLRGLQPYVPGKPVEELERDYGIAGAIKLASNENPLGPSDKVLSAINACAPELNRYPDGNGWYLKQVLARHLGVDEDCLTLGNGSNDILVMLAEVFLTPETSAVYSEYAFLIYPLVVQAAGATALVASANAAEEQQPLGHNLDAMLASVRDDTRLIFVANPNNPTGTWVDGDTLRRFLDRVPSTVIVVLDEAYYEYASGEGYPETIAWLERYPNLVITRTFSKAYGLAGLRLGYSVCDPRIADLLNRLRQPFNVNSMALAAALAALADTEHLDQSRTLNENALVLLQQELRDLGYAVIPSRANFVLLRIGEEAAACYEYLLRQGVIVRPVANYGLPDYLRVSTGLPDEMERFVLAMRRFREERS